MRHASRIGRVFGITLDCGYVLGSMLQMQLDLNSYTSQLPASPQVFVDSSTIKANQNISIGVTHKA